MLRLNCFFELKDGADRDKVIALGKELVEKSLGDAGNAGYDLFMSATRPGVMMFCETWKDQASLDAHSASAHFTRIVPQIEAETKSGLNLEQFTF